MTVSGADGAFTYAGVAPGQYSVVARSLEAASTEENWIRVQENETTRVNLSLAPGTMLLVQVVDASGADVKAWISVEDPEGRELNGMIGFAHILRRMSEGFDSDLQRIGPLPPGEYTVRIEAEDGRTAKKPVTLDGREERKLKIRLR